MRPISKSQTRPDRVYVLLERARAGLGAAGVTAAFAEGIASTRSLTGVLGGLSTPLIAVLAVLAFLFASYVVDVPLSREQDLQK